MRLLSVTESEAYRKSATKLKADSHMSQPCRQLCFSLLLDGWVEGALVFVPFVNVFGISVEAKLCFPEHFRARRFAEASAIRKMLVKLRRPLDKQFLIDEFASQCRAGNVDAMCLLHRWMVRDKIIPRLLEGYRSCVYNGWIRGMALIRRWREKNLQKQSSHSRAGSSDENSETILYAARLKSGTFLRSHGNRSKVIRLLMRWGGDITAAINLGSYESVEDAAVKFLILFREKLAKRRLKLAKRKALKE